SSKGVNACGCANGKLDDTPSPPRWCQRRETWSASGRSRTARKNFWRDEATADTANRTATGVSSGAGLGRFVGRGENAARRPQPQDPPCHPPPPHPVARRQVASLNKTSDQQQLLLGRPRGDLGARFVHEHVD